MQNLENFLGYSFANKNLLKQALTHSSVSSDIHKNYERLEFLGDRILGFTVAEMLYKHFPNEPEGDLAPRHTSLVCKDAVSEVAKLLHIDEYVMIANEDIRENDNVLCDVGEAVIGAICIDSNVNNAIDFVRKNWEPLLEKYVTPPKDAKTMLQEIAHTLKLGAPEYVVLEKSGAEHLPLFKIAVNLAGGRQTIGEGHSKKLAEQQAAAKMLKQLGCGNAAK